MVKLLTVLFLCISPQAIPCTLGSYFYVHSTVQYLGLLDRNKIVPYKTFGIRVCTVRVSKKKFVLHLSNNLGFPLYPF